MNTFIITYICVVSLCMVGIIISMLSPYIPMVVERETWKVWKQCYNDDNFIKTFECEYGTRYDWTDNDYYAIVDNRNDEMTAAIFIKSRLDKNYNVFCSYYRWHSKKLAEKLMKSNK